GLLCWDGFSAKAMHTRQSPLLRMRENGQQLHAAVSLRENTAEGLGPDFQSEGFIRPPEVPLITEGRLDQLLVSPRTAREYGLVTNGADNGAEAPTSLEMAPGTLAQAGALAALGTGLYVKNLWYLNFSDRMNARMTGMTRFATFWVENGVIQAPCEVMRFDDSLFQLLGEKLEALTREREFLPDTSTYERRQTQSVRLPGALVRDFNLTL
ncbi:MAG: metallopeptidase TldD-related protein, partial [Deltaproteobacteria bacterium]